MHFVNKKMPDQRLFHKKKINVKFAKLVSATHILQKTAAGITTHLFIESSTFIYFNWSTPLYSNNPSR